MTWGKLHAGAVDDRKFDLIAELAESTPLAAWGVFSSALDHALQHGGDLSRFSLELVAHRWRLALVEVERIWHEMGRLGLIVGERFRAWAERQAKPGRVYSQKPDAVHKRAQRDRAKAHRTSAGTSAGTSGWTCQPSPAPLPESRLEDPPCKSPPLNGGERATALARDVAIRKAAVPTAIDLEVHTPQQVEILYPIDGGRRSGRWRETRSQRRARELAEHQAQRRVLLGIAS